jgi:hypothetical protein
MAPTTTCRYIATLLLLTAVAACNGPTNPSGGPPPIASGSLAAVNGVAELAEFEVCKVYSGIVGPAVTVNFTVDRDANGSIENSGSVQLANNQCAVVHTYIETGSNNGTQIQRVTVTEQVPTGYTVSRVLTTVTLGGPSSGGSVASNTATGDMISNPDNGFLVVFTNTAEPSLGDGRFTGGGNQIRVDGVRVSRGLTIHCDLLLSNNLEVNWGQGDNFHMTEHLTTVACTDDPNIIQAPPPAPLDTLIGTGTGTFNGVAGFTVQFTLQDFGEPGSADRMAIRIFQASNPSNVVLNIPLSLLANGNLQAHFDQPHK